MPLILSLETATTVCSVAITKGKEIVAERKLYEDKSHANQLTLIIEELIQSAGLKMSEVQAVAGDAADDVATAAPSDANDAVAEGDEDTGE